MKHWRFYRWYICFPFVFLLVHHVCHSTTSCVNKLHMQAILDSALFFIRSGRATGVKGRRMLLCRVELCVTEMSASRQILMIYIKTVASVAPC